MENFGGLDVIYRFNLRQTSCRLSFTGFDVHIWFDRKTDVDYSIYAECTAPLLQAD